VASKTALGSESLKQSSAFVYNYDFDQNGALYALGSRSRSAPWNNPHVLSTVTVFFSSLRTGKLEDFVGRDVVNCSTRNEQNSFMGVDLGLGR